MRSQRARQESDTPKLRATCAIDCSPWRGPTRSRQPGTPLGTAWACCWSFQRDRSLTGKEPTEAWAVPSERSSLQIALHIEHARVTVAEPGTYQEAGGAAVPFGSASCRAAHGFVLEPGNGSSGIRPAARKAASAVSAVQKRCPWAVAEQVRHPLPPLAMADRTGARSCPQGSCRLCHGTRHRCLDAAPAA